MGTRSLTYFYRNSDSENPLVCMYRQFDGYPEGHGKDIFEFVTETLSTSKDSFGNSYNSTATPWLAMQTISAFKDQLGVFLIEPTLNHDCWQEYEYHIFPDRIEVSNPYMIIFSGTLEEFGKFCNDPENYKKEEVMTNTKSLRDLLSEGEVRVKFTKADGSVRVMRCTKNFDLIPEDFHFDSSDNSIKNADPKLFKVFDLDIDDWRSFREERVISYRAI